jgi:tetratricopeptide (TPR) repeat protein
MIKKRIVLFGLFFLLAAGGCCYILRAFRSTPEQISKTADKFFSLDSLDAARLQYLRVMREDPGNTHAIRQLALIWEAMGSPVQTAAYFARARAIWPDDPDIQKRLAKAVALLGQLEDAKLLAGTVLDKAPTDGEALLILADASRTDDDLAALEARADKFDSYTSAQYQVVSAGMALRNGDAAEAEAALATALKISPDSSMVHLAFANFYEAVRQREKSLLSLKRAAELSEERSAVRLDYARALAKEGKIEEAEGMMRAIAEKFRFYIPAWTSLAELELQKKKPEESISILNEVFTRDPINPHANLLKTSALQMQGKTRDAVRQMEEMNRIFPGQIAISMTLARSFLLDSDPAQAISVLDGVLRRAPNYSEAVLLLAQTKITSGEAAGASSILEKALKNNPGLLAASDLLAKAYEAQGRFDEAKTIYQAETARKPDNMEAFYKLGMVFRAQGKGPEALSAFGKAQSLAPDNPAVTEQLIDLDMSKLDFAAAHERVKTLEVKTPGTWYPPYLKGKIFTAEEKWPEAEQALLEAIGIVPDSLPSYSLLITGYMKQGRIAEVIRRLEQYLEHKPEDSPRRLILAMICGQDGQQEKEIAAYKQILEQNPNFVTALNNFANLCAGPLNDLDQAQKLAAKARALQPASPEVADTFGWILYRSRNYSQALSLISEAAAKLPENAEVQYHLGMVRYMQGQKQQARALLTKAVASGKEFTGLEKAKESLTLLSEEGGVNLETIQRILKETPEDATARMRLAQLQEADGKFAEAAKSYQTALETNPSLLDALNSLSRLYLVHMGDTEKAVEYARKARALDDRDLKVARTLGEALLQRGEFSYAYTLLKDALSSDPENRLLSITFARAAYGTGRVTEARAACQKFSNPDGASAPETEEAKRFLVLTDAAPGPAVLMAAEVLKNDQNNLPALMAKAAGLLAGDKAAEAITVYEALLGKYPDFVPAQKELSQIFSLSGNNLDKARSLAEKASQLLPGDAELERILGTIEYQQGNFPAAVRLLRRSNSTSPLSAQGLYYLGMGSLKVRQQKEGLDVLKRALDAGLSAPLKQQAEETLAKEASASTR